MCEVGESSPTVMVPGLGVSIGGDTCMKNRSDLIYTCAWLHYLNWILCVICDQGKNISGKKIKSELTWKKAKFKKIGWNTNISLKKKWMCLYVLRFKQRCESADC